MLQFMYEGSDTDAFVYLMTLILYFLFKLEIINVGDRENIINWKK